MAALEEELASCERALADAVGDASRLERALADAVGDATRAVEDARRGGMDSSDASEVVPGPRELPKLIVGVGF